MSPSTVILASAGSGKTWQLTTHFLRLLAAGVKPQQVLASTFTRKAAGEILGRIFARLAEAAGEEGAARALDRALESGPRSREQYLALLAGAARSIHCFRVRTLDAFFVEVAQAFAFELALPPGWSIADEVAARRVRAQALSQALEGGKPADWSALLRELERDADGRSVHETTLALVDEGHTLACESEREAWDRIAVPAALGEEQLAELIARVEALKPALTKTGSVNQHWAGSIQRTRRCLAERAWVEVFKDGLGEKVLAGETTFSRVPIPDPTREVFLALARHAAAIVGAELARQNRATRRLLEAFDREYRSLQRRRGTLRFEDLPLALACHRDIVGSEGASDLALRLDARIDHLMLDEFQDTSPLQWRVLAPLAEELAADGTGERSFFCVGDPKQSIYGWRSAEPRLLESLPERLHLEPRKLDESRRSAQVVLEAVNRAFLGLASNPVFDEKPELRPAAAQIAASFREHTTHDRALRGSARIHMARAGAGSFEATSRCMERAVEIVAEIRERAPSASIAVLLRRRSFAAHVMLLLRRQGIAASDEGGNPLTDSVAVQSSLSLLHWLDHPGDGAARFHAATSIVGRAAGLRDDLSEAEAAQVRIEMRREIVERGLAEWLASLAPPVATALGGWEAGRFGQLVDLALAWRDELGPRLADFVERVREEAVEDSSGAQVKVMTIHAAKGLEFDAVVLPELDRDLLHGSPRFVWRRRGDDPARELEAVSRGAPAIVGTLLERVGEPTYRELELGTRARELRDELGALYVAMTRARHRLDLVLWPDASKPRKFTASGLLRQAFDLVHDPLGELELVHTVEGSDDGWTESAAISAKALVTPPRSPALLAFRESRRTRELERQSPSQLRAPQVVATRELFAPAGERFLRRGSRWHAWFERVEWIESFLDDDAVLRAHAEALGFGGEGLEEDLIGFRAALSRPRLRQLLARGAGEREAWRERRFAQVLDAGEPRARLITGAFDRVVVTREGGRIARADLVDFKTDRVGSGADELARQAEGYRPQVSAYRAALARITGLPPEQVAAVLYFVEGDRVVVL